MASRTLGRGKSGDGRGPKNRTASADARDSAIAAHEREHLVWVAGPLGVARNMGMDCRAICRVEQSASRVGPR